jgi:peroxiredoxin
MAQLRHDYEKFTALNAEILVVVPNGPFMINRYLSNHPTPYPILTDKGSKVAEQYFQAKQLFAFGTPTVIIVDRAGKIAYTHYADSLIEEPGDDEPLAVLANQQTN